MEKNLLLDNEDHIVIDDISNEFSLSLLVIGSFQELLTLLELVDLFHKQCSITLPRDSRGWHSNQWSITEEDLLLSHWIHVRPSHRDIETH